MTTPPRFHIRNWNTQSDFPRIAAIRSGILPDITTVEMLREEEAKQRPQLQMYRRVAVDADDRVLGYAEVWRSPWDVPGDWRLSLMVEGEARRQGIGSALYQAMRDYLYTQQAAVCRVQTRDNQPDGLTFAQRRGIATALKLLTVQFAQKQGAYVIRTNNDATNAPMLAINRKLGYKPEPGHYALRCSF